VKINYSKETFVEFLHKPVLLKEIINFLNIKPNGIYIDCTAGGGGHSQSILEKIDSGKLIAIDQDPEAIYNLKKKFSKKNNLYIIQSNFINIKEKLAEIGIYSIDGVLFDLGVSSYQLDNPERGFSYNKNCFLDMRMSKNGISAHDIINNYSEENLAKILKKYGEEKFCRKISRNIIKARAKNPIETTIELVEIIKNSVPASIKRLKHPAKKTFQAIRIEVNKELENLEKGLNSVFPLLKSSGRLLVITFHSLEDRLVKKKIINWCQGCTCPNNFPICICKKNPEAILINKKTIKPSISELKTNPRSRSAKLRGIIKI
jgi:16S rRNA (cytosine1402-N4)-methyltransferase